MRYIIKTDSPDGVPTKWEIDNFEQRKGVKVGEINRLYVTFKVKKRRKIKRLRIGVKSYPCELCGYHTYAHGSVGKKEFDLELY
jgi:hypothetical protein